MCASSDADSIYSECEGEGLERFTLPPRRPAPDHPVIISRAIYVDAELDSQESENEQSESTDGTSQTESASSLKIYPRDLDLQQLLTLKSGDEEEFEDLDLCSIRSTSRPSKIHSSQAFLSSLGDELDFGNCESDVGHDVAIGFSPRASGFSTRKAPKNDIAETAEGRKGVSASGTIKRGGSWHAAGHSSLGPTEKKNGNASLDLRKATGKSQWKPSSTEADPSGLVKRRSVSFSGERQQSGTPSEKAFFGGIAKASGSLFRGFKSPKPDGAGRKKPLDVDRSQEMSLSPSGVVAAALILEEFHALKSSDSNEDDSLIVRKSVEDHKQHVTLLEALITTLKGAKAGFVDLALLRPMTLKTCETISTEVMCLLEGYGAVQMRISELEKETVDVEKKTEAEVEEKETILIGVKMSLAEAQSEVMTLEHELRLLRRKISESRRQGQARVAEATIELAGVKDARYAGDFEAF